MAITYKATFRPEKRKKNGELIIENVPLMLDINFRGRIWYNTGYRLLNINDFDQKAQKLKSGKKALRNGVRISATLVNNSLDGMKGTILQVYNNARTEGKPITAEYLLNETRKILDDVIEEVTEEPYMIHDFIDTLAIWDKKNMIGKLRLRDYNVLIRTIIRFEKINKLHLKTSDWNTTVIDDFQNFLFNEYTYINKFPEIYKDEKRLPKKREQNTVSMRLKMLHSFFTYKEAKDDIVVNPFRKYVKQEKGAMLVQAYDEPYHLTLDELHLMINNEAPENLAKVRDCLLVHIAIGCRIENFNDLTWNDVIIGEFYTVHYTPYKTSHGRTLEPIDCPIVLFAKNIIEKYKNTGLLAPVFKNNVSGENGYNAQIKKLLEYYEINRPVSIRRGGKPISVPLCSVASSKIARKTHVDITAKIGLNKYISGLHKEGSDAVDAYTSLNLKEKFYAYCQAFGEEPYSL